MICVGALREQIRRQRELIFQMDEHYQKQLNGFYSTIARLQNGRVEMNDPPLTSSQSLKRSGNLGNGVSLSALPPLKPPEFTPKKNSLRRATPSLTLLPPLEI
jgi:hypothetical protein